MRVFLIRFPFQKSFIFNIIWQYPFCIYNTATYFVSCVYEKKKKIACAQDFDNIYCFLITNIGVQTYSRNNVRLKEFVPHWSTPIVWQ